MPGDSSDPRSPSSIIHTTRSIFYTAVYHQMPGVLNAALELPAKTLQRYQERDRRYDARQGAIGDPYRGFIDPGLADEIEERQRQDNEMKGTAPTDTNRHDGKG